MGTPDQDPGMHQSSSVGPEMRPSLPVWPGAARIIERRVGQPAEVRADKKATIARNLATFRASRELRDARARIEQGLPVTEVDPTEL